MLGCTDYYREVECAWTFNLLGTFVMNAKERMQSRVFIVGIVIVATIIASFPIHSFLIHKTQTPFFMYDKIRLIGPTF